MGRWPKPPIRSSDLSASSSRRPSSADPGPSPGRPPQQCHGWLPASGLEPGAKAASRCPTVVPTLSMSLRSRTRQPRRAEARRGRRGGPRGAACRRRGWPQPSRPSSSPHQHARQAERDPAGTSPVEQVGQVARAGIPTRLTALEELTPPARRAGLSSLTGRLGPGAGATPCPIGSKRPLPPDKPEAMATRPRTGAGSAAATGGVGDAHSAFGSANPCFTWPPDPENQRSEAVLV
jgi:hypothetical protein